MKTPRQRALEVFHREWKPFYSKGIPQIMELAITEAITDSDKEIARLSTELASTREVIDAAKDVELNGMHRVPELRAALIKYQQQVATSGEKAKPETKSCICMKKHSHNKMELFPDPKCPIHGLPKTEEAECPFKAGDRVRPVRRGEVWLEETVDKVIGGKAYFSNGDCVHAKLWESTSGCRHTRWYPTGEHPIACYDCGIPMEWDAQAKRMVPKGKIELQLSSDDVPVGSSLKRKHWAEPARVESKEDDKGVWYCRKFSFGNMVGYKTFQELKEQEWLINRHDGKGFVPAKK